MMGHLKSLIAEMSLKEDVKVFSSRFAARGLLAASTADCSFDATRTHLFESSQICCCFIQLSHARSQSFMNVTLVVRASVTQIAPHAHILLGQPACRSPTCSRGKGWIELAGCKEGASVASPQQNPLHTLLCHLERMPVSVFRSVNREPCQFKGIHSQLVLSVWRVKLIERDIVCFGHSERFFFFYS